MNIYILVAIVSFLFGIICYLATNSIFVALIVILLTTLYFVLIGTKKTNKYKIKISRFHSCYLFINNFIIALSIKKAIKPAFDSTIVTMDEDIQELIDSIKENTEEDKLKYLTKYFKFDIYNLFLDLIALWLDQGGDIISMSSNLTNRARELEEYVSEAEQIHNKKFIEFTILWTFSLAILVFLRFALSQFFSKITSQLFYLIGIGTIFVYVLITIHLLISKMTTLDIKGWKDD